MRRHSALCAAQGDDVTIAVATNGDAGSGDPDPARAGIAHVRPAEAQASADVTGASLIWTGFRTSSWLRIAPVVTVLSIQSDRLDQP